MNDTQSKAYGKNIEIGKNTYYQNLAEFTIDVYQFIRKTLFTARHSTCCYPEDKFGLIPALYKSLPILLSYRQQFW